MAEKFLKSLIKNIDTTYIQYESLKVRTEYIKNDTTFFQILIWNDQEVFGKFIQFSDLSKYFIFQEINNLITFRNHANVVKLLGITYHSHLSKDNNYHSSNEEIKRSEWIGILLENAPFGSVKHSLQINSQTTFERRLKWCIQLCQIIHHLHEKNYIHRDIKPDNVLLFDNDVIKLCDFELSQHHLEELATTTYKGTVEFSAPETFRTRSNDDNKYRGKHTFGSDIFSLGLTIACILTNKATSMCESKTNFINLSIVHAKDIILECYHQELKRLLLLCIDDSPTKRISIPELTNVLLSIDQQERFRIFKEKENIKNQDEINFFSYLMSKNLLLVYNFFDIQFAPNQNNMEYLEYGSNLGDIKLIDYYLYHPKIQEQLHVQNNELDQRIIKSFEIVLKKDFHEAVDYWKQSDIWNHLCNETIEKIFYLCVENNNMSMISYFFENIQNKIKKKQILNRAYLIACEYDSLDILIFFIEQYSTFFDIHTKNPKNGNNALILACYKGHFQIVKYLIENEISPFRDIYAQNKYGSTALMQACEIGHFDLICYLIENKSCPMTNLTHLDKWGNNVLIWAVYKSHFNIVQYLLSNPICPFKDIYRKDNRGNNALLWASNTNSLDILMYLLENQFRPFQQIYETDKAGQNILMIASSLGHLDMVRYILESSPFKEILKKDKNGKTAYDLASTQEIKSYLEPLYS